jgi:hypothetical protein
MKRALAVAALAAAALAPAFAQDASSDFDAPPAAAPATATDWGSLKYSGDQAFAWRWAADSAAARTGGFLDSTMKGEYKYHDFKVVAGASVRYNEFVPEETALYWSPGSFRFGVGLQEFSWGVADKANPTDTLNARDYRYDVDAPRLVNPAASVAYYPASWVSLEAVYEPWKVESKYPTDFPGTTQAQLTSNATALNAATAALGNPLATYVPTVTTAASTAGTFNTPVYGGRANFFLPGVDLSLSYLYDRDSFYTPVVTMSSYGGVWVPQSVNLVYNPVQRFGLNVKTTVDRFGFWLESAYNHTVATWDDTANRHDSFNWTAGLDFNYGPASVYYINLQYAGVWVMNYDASTVAAQNASLGVAQLTSESYMQNLTYRSLTQTLGDQTEQMLNSLMLRMNWPLNNATVTPSLSGVVAVPYNYDSTDLTRYASAYLNPEIDVMPADGLHLVAGADLAYAWVKVAGGSSVTLDTTYDRLGVYTPQNNLYVRVDFKWNGSLGNS